MSDAGFGNKKVGINQRRYLGSKVKLLNFIDEILIKEKVEYSSFADLFAGTGVVSSYFYDKSRVIINDILSSNYQSYLAFFGKEKIRTKWLEKKLEYYNELNPDTFSDNYFSKNFSNTYFDKYNAKLIGIIRDDIEVLSSESKVNTREKAYLITSLIYGLDRIANTVGHYDAYRKIEIPKYKLELRPLLIHKRKYSSKIFKMDANQLVRQIQADVVYIDPPYNSRQYSDAYHLLENIAEWNKQPVYGVAKKIDRAHIKSQYSLKSAGNAFSDLINNLDTKYILVSYNDMGTSGDARSQSRITDHEIVSALERRGAVTIYEKAFGQFTTGKSKKDNLKERIFFCKVDSKIKPKPSISSSNKNTHRSEYAKSPLNYTGGKHKLLPQLSPLFPDKIHTFYDIFCGGANVGINAKADSVVCLDNTKQVIDLLKFIKSNNFEELHQQILKVIEKYGLSQSYINGYDFYGADSSRGLGKYNKEAFLNLRKDYNLSDDICKPLLLLVLILYSFNNQIRFNSKSEFNLPVGKRDYNGSSRKNLADFNALTNLKPIAFEFGDFRDIENIKFYKDDFIYLDPPYLLGLASYNEGGGWTKKDDRDLYDLLDKLNAKNVKFALSNVIEHKGETNNSLIEWAKNKKMYVNYLDYDYKNSSYQSTAKNGITKEVLITNYKP